MAYNKVILLGNLTRDPEMKHLGGESRLCSFGMACSKKFTSQGQQREETMFIDVTCWGRTADIANEYLSKGKQVLIDGELKLEQWDDKETGKKRTKHSVTATTLQMVGGPSKGEPEQRHPKIESQADRFYDAPGGDDDVPF